MELRFVEETEVFCTPILAITIKVVTIIENTELGKKQICEGKKYELSPKLAIQKISKKAVLI